MSGPSPLPLPHVAKLHAYTPGLQPTEPGWVKLNTNECPYPPSPAVAEALHRDIGLDGAALRLYPHPKSGPLRRAVAQLHGLTEENVIIGNGSDDILNLLVRAFCSPACSDKEVPRDEPPITRGPLGDSSDVSALSSKEAMAGFTFPSYSLYPVLVEIQNGRSRVVEFDRSMRLPLERIASSSARVFFLTSPNAPTGVGFPISEFEEILSRFKGLLVIDEAYALFAEENAEPLLARHPNLVIVRTLSKAYALAGIRVGYALAQPEVIELLDRVRDSYNVNRLSQVAAVAAINDAAYYAMVIARIKATRDATLARFTKSGWFTYPSQTNFIFTEPKNARGESGRKVAKSACDFLFSRRVLIRYFGSHALTDSFLRISVGTDDEMIVLHDTLDAWQKASPNV